MRKTFKMLSAEEPTKANEMYCQCSAMFGNAMQLISTDKANSLMHDRGLSNAKGRCKGLISFEISALAWLSSLPSRQAACRPAKSTQCCKGGPAMAKSSSHWAL